MLGRTSPCDSSCNPLSKAFASSKEKDGESRIPRLAEAVPNLFDMIVRLETTIADMDATCGLSRKIARKPTGLPAMHVL
jgi:hypothetical protein